tara:strand:+ start:62 stop:340 length:279 start_codon:yes stop_codon:yes gene_type:complete
MNSLKDTAKAVGFPIRKSPDQSLLAAPRSLSQRATSFIASQCQGIHQMLLSFLTLLQNRHAQKSIQDNKYYKGLKYSHAEHPHTGLLQPAFD